MTVVNADQAVTDFAVRIDTLPIEGVALDGSNLRVFDDVGTELDRFVEDIGGLAVWVRFAQLPVGATSLTLDACEAGASPDNDAGAVFAWVLSAADFDDKWTVTQTDFDNLHDIYAGVTMGGDTLTARAQASCFDPPYDGTLTTGIGALLLPAGDYRLEFAWDWEGGEWAFCQGTGKTHSSEVSIDGQSVLALSYTTMDNNSMSCEVAVGNNFFTSAPVSLSGATPLEVRTVAEDCGYARLEISAMRLRRVLDPAPLVIVP